MDRRTNTTQSRSKLKLALVVHNHQPIGNFDFVVRQACADSYWPFLDLFERHATLRLSLHISGSLLDWLLQHEPDYVERVRRLVLAGRIELLAGPQYEPILAGIPRRDRIGQIRRYVGQLRDVFGTVARGMWTPERVWEPSFTADLAEAGIDYTVLDDYHFLSNGVRSDELIGYFVTEDQGRLLRVFPGNERLRYLIPFRPVSQTIELLRKIARRRPGSTLVFADDGEKFGTWPGTKEHVYERGWLERFFRALERNAGWLQTVTLGEVVQTDVPVGRVQLPECSYREMTEWAMPVDLQLLRRRLVSALRETPFAENLSPLLRGASWRNFRRRYDEANEMYSRMLLVSKRLADAVARIGGDPSDAATLPALLEAARDHLYRAQCNCPYWHGAFGGLYLPFLRTAVYRHLILADRALDRWQSEYESGDAVRAGVRATGSRPRGGRGPAAPSAKKAARPLFENAGNSHVGAESDRVRPELPDFGMVCDDFDADGHQELRIRTATLDLFVAPHRGGQLYELDVVPIAYNVLATMDRRPEAYHDDVRDACHRLRRQPHSPSRSTGSTPADRSQEATIGTASDTPNAPHKTTRRPARQQSEGVASIHEAVRVKRPDLDRWLVYDRCRRKGMVDHFVKPAAGPADLQRGRRTLGDFSTAAYRVVSERVDTGRGIVRIRLRAHGTVEKLPVTVEKRLELRAEHPERLDVTYRITGLTGQPELAFVSEFNVAGLAADADDRYFECRGRRLGRLSTTLCQRDCDALAVVDEWLGLRLLFAVRPQCDWWTFPICTVSGSESGYELVQQSAAVAARWLVRPDARGCCRLRWSLRCECRGHS